MAHLDKRSATDRAKRRAFRIACLINPLGGWQSKRSDGPEGILRDATQEEVAQDRIRYVQHTWQNPKLPCYLSCCVNPRRAGQRSLSEHRADLDTLEQLSEFLI